MTAWLALMLGYPGFACLAVAMDRHGEDMLKRPVVLRWRRVAQFVGGVLLTMGLLICVRHWGGSVGTAVWLGVLTFSAMTVGILLTYKPHAATLLAIVLAPCALAASLGWWLR